MTSNWAKPRNEIIDIGVKLVRCHQSYTPESIADSLTHYHYIGKSPERAASILARDIRRLDFFRPSQQTLELEAMERELQAEGWRWIPVPDTVEGFFYHDQTGMSVNCNGGGFRFYGDAVRRAYNSPVRDWVKERT